MRPAWWISGERVPPVHKPRKQKQCQWVTGIGWVYNPTRKGFAY